MKYFKLNEDDLLEIIIDYCYDQCPELSSAHAVFLGESGKDLRCIAVLDDDEFLKVTDEQIKDIDENKEFNGDHSFLENHPEFYL